MPVLIYGLNGVVVPLISIRANALYSGYVFVNQFITCPPVATSTVDKKSSAIMTNAETLHALIDSINAQGLSKQEIHRAEVMLDYQEYGLAFDMVLQKLFESNRWIKTEQFALIESAASRLRIPESEFSFAKGLVH